MSRPRRFLVMAQGGHADGLRAVPFVRAVREGHPDAHISVLGYGFARELWIACPYVDRFIATGDDAILGRGGRARLLKLLRVARLIPRLVARFDVFVNLEVQAEGGFPGLLSALLGIPVRVGHGGRRQGVNLSPGRADMRVPYEDRMSELLDVLGLPDGDLRLEAWSTAEDGLAVEATLAAAGRRPASPLVVCHPGSDWSCQMWSAARWADLADRLANEFGADVAFTGLAGEADFITDIGARVASPILNLAGRTTYSQLCALLARASLVVALDTLVAPLASAMGAPVVTIAAYDTSNWSRGRTRELRIITEFTVAEPAPWSVTCHWNRIGRVRGCQSASCVGRHALAQTSVEQVTARARPVLAPVLKAMVAVP